MAPHFCIICETLPGGGGRLKTSLRSMKTIVLSGQWNTGKSFAIFHAVKWLCEKYTGFEYQDVPFDKALYAGRKYCSEESDLRTLLNVNGKKILFCSATDDEECIMILKDILNQLAVNQLYPDILVTSCRRYDDTPYPIMIREMGWREDGKMLFDKDGHEIIQIPLLRAKYEHGLEVIDWYNELTARQLQIILELMIFDK